MSEDLDKVTLRDHFQKQIDWVDKYFQRQLDNSKEEVEKAYQQLEARLAGMNEFRDTLKDQAARLASKDDVTNLEKRINMLERGQSSGEGRDQNKAVVWGVVLSLLGNIVAIILALRK